MAGRSSRAAAKHAHRLFTPGRTRPVRFSRPARTSSTSRTSCGEPPGRATQAGRVGPDRPEKARRRRRRGSGHGGGVGAGEHTGLVEDTPGGGALRGKTRRWEMGEDDEEWGEGAGAVIPPHELLDRNRAASFSVHEGVGRTLKGRDLSRVRNAIWEKTGFQD
uniref:Uncharacterized protein n=1 Tax=Ananas comosus var. bracteatus TaxID=296719 RepID=A0A6V7QLG6_ANACO|nr:unnamed protein product [Ananas comosus var. bracteatus]